MGDEIKRVLLSDSASGTCLVDCIYKWDYEQHSSAVTSLIMVFMQFSKEIQGGGINRIILENKELSPHFLPPKTIPRSNSSNNISTPTDTKPSSDLGLVCASVGGFTASVFLNTTDEHICSRAREFANIVAKKFSTDHGAATEKFKQVFADINEGEEVEENQKKVFDEFQGFQGTIQQLKQEFYSQQSNN